MRKSQKKCFMGAMTGGGFVHFFGEIVDMFGLKKLYILKGGSGTGKGTFIKKFADLHKNHDVILIYCSAEPGSLDGAVVADMGIGIVDGTAPHLIDHKYPGLCEEIVDLTVFIDPSKLAGKRVTREQIDTLTEQKKACYASAAAELARAGSLHRELETLYSGCVDFEKMDALFDNLFVSKNAPI